MFGYIVPVKKELLRQDYVLYRSFYCGICKLIGKNYGQLPRFTTTYDITFLSLLVFDQLNADVQFAEETCIGNPVRRHVIVKGNSLLDRLAAANVILSYHKLRDDVIDGAGRGRRTMLRALGRPYRQALALCPGIDAIVKRGYDGLRKLEQAGETGIDRAAHPFAALLKEAALDLVGGEADGPLARLCYNLGKFVYLIDALDDIDEDAKSGNYNPFLKRFGNYQNRRQFLTDNAPALDFILASTVNRAIACFNELNFTQSYSLLKNIVHLGLRDKVNEVFASGKKLDRPRI
ncbi:MAG: DUF5685 family protein [Clostridiales bacterium]|jgi:hypothetical protein|nr:DUF5685 family protein [Clostridiales bacterium]